MTNDNPKHIAAMKKNPLVFHNKAYDVLKFIAQIFLPAFGTFYFALAQTWGLHNGVEVVGTVTAVDAFLGVLLGLSSSVYKKSESRFDGEINVTQTIDGIKQAALVLKNYADPADVVKQKEVTFKVNPS